MAQVFISYSHDDAIFAERLARDLKDAGFEVWIDFRGIQAGTEWENQIFKGISSCDFLVVCLTPTAVRSDWVRREVLMGRSQNKRIFPLLVKKKAETSAGILETIKLLSDYQETRKLSDIQMVDFERYGYERAFPMLLEGLPSSIDTPTALQTATATASEIDPAEIPNPFKGLEAFQQTDAKIFFGREALVEKLLQRLSDKRADRFLAITGASGSGKSSLVRAGLIPKIRASALPESASWPLVIFTPGPLPTEALITRLKMVVDNYGLPASTLDSLKASPEGMHVLTETLLNEAPRTARLVLVIDQFEEVFTRATAEDAAQFLDLIVSAATQPDGRTLIILTMRADFFDRLSAYPKLATLFEQENLVIATEMLPEDLRRSIEGPAEAVGLAYELGLVETILEDVRQQPGSLPLLQYALKELYKARDGRWLKSTAYKAMGGVRGALSGHADGIYKVLKADQQDLLRRVLVRLVEVSPTGEATRRRVNRNTLTFQGVKPEAVDAIIDLLAKWDNRLLIANRDINAVAENAPTMVEISHEALVREWPKLREWIKDDEADLHYGGELLKDAYDWEKHARDTEFLLQGDRRVVEAQLWLERADANELQRAYITSSVAKAERIKTEKEQAQAEKLRMAETAAANAKRAEVAEKDRAVRFEEAARIASRRTKIAAAVAGVAVIGIMIAVLAAVNAAGQTTSANNQLGTATVVQGHALVQVATAQFNSTVSAFDAQRLSTQVLGLGQIPPTLFATIPPQDAFATATQIANAYGHDDDVIKTFDDGVEMVQVPAGCFWMGSTRFDKTVPITYICFQVPFWIDRFEVTNEQYARLAKAQPHSRFTGDKRPVESITWFDARDYCERTRKGARLPTEAEWEYVAAGPDSYPYPWGREFPEKIEDYAVFDQQETADVGIGIRDKGRSWVGAYDMAGNVSEWISSVYKDYPYNATDGREADTGDRGDIFRGLRGGTWVNDGTVGLLTSYRSRNASGDQTIDSGFRCTRSSEP